MCVYMHTPTYPHTEHTHTLPTPPTTHTHTTHHTHPHRNQSAKYLWVSKPQNDLKRTKPSHTDYTVCQTHYTQTAVCNTCPLCNRVATDK